MIKTAIKFLIKNVFGGVSWLLQSIVEYWRMYLIFGLGAYFIFISLVNRNLRSEVHVLSNRIEKQDSIIITVRSRFLEDSTNMASQTMQFQILVAEINNENKRLKQEVIAKDKLVQDLANGVKCKNIFGKIVNCK